MNHWIISFDGRNRVIVKDAHGTIKKVYRKHVQPTEMDISAEFVCREREQSTTRDAKHVMPKTQILDLKWEFDENSNQLQPYKIKEINILETIKEEQTKEEELENCRLKAVTPEQQETVVTEHQTNSFTVAMILAALKPVANAVAQQITNRKHF